MIGLKGATQQPILMMRRPYVTWMDMTPIHKSLADMGYQCGMTGKWHLGDSVNPQCGFAHWHVIERGGSNYYDSTFIDNGELKQSQEYITDRITNDALQFIEKRYQDEVPFYLSVHYTAPHDPWWEKQHPQRGLGAL